MAYNFRGFTPGQLLLLPPNLDDWLPQQHLARWWRIWTSNRFCAGTDPTGKAARLSVRR